MVAMILIESGMECMRIVSGQKAAAIKETPFVMTKLAIEEQG
jgi:hypothetical protein